MAGLQYREEPVLGGRKGRRRRKDHRTGAMG